MSATGIRLQLFGIALILVGGFYGLQKAVQGYSGTDDAAYVVTAGLLITLLGLLSVLTDGDD